jgi:hypothetical protein
MDDLLIHDAMIDRLDGQKGDQRGRELLRKRGRSLEGHSAVVYAGRGYHHRHVVGCCLVVSCGFMQTSGRLDVAYTSEHGTSVVRGIELSRFRPGRGHSISFSRLLEHL